MICETRREGAAFQRCRLGEAEGWREWKLSAETDDLAHAAVTLSGQRGGSGGGNGAGQRQPIRTMTLSQEKCSLYTIKLPLKSSWNFLVCFIPAYFQIRRRTVNIFTGKQIPYKGGIGFADPVVNVTVSTAPTRATKAATTRTLGLAATVHTNHVWRQTERLFYSLYSWDTEATAIFIIEMPKPILITHQSVPEEKQKYYITHISMCNLYILYKSNRKAIDWLFFTL